MMLLSLRDWVTQVVTWAGESPAYKRIITAHQTEGLASLSSALGEEESARGDVGVHYSNSI